MLVAISVVLDGWFSIKLSLFGAYSLKITFGMLPKMLAGIWFGPIWGAAVGAMADVTQVTLFPAGGYIPWFSVSSALFGVIPWLFFMKTSEFKPLRTFFAVAITFLVTSVCINTFLLVVFYGSPWEIIYARAITQAIMIPVHTVLLLIIDRSMRLVKLRPR